MPVTCPYCHLEFLGDKLNARHLSICNPSSTPKVEPCLCGHESTSLTQMKRHRQNCVVWKNRDKAAVQTERLRATSLERYGVEDARRSQVANAKREATNQEKYGAANPFCRGSSVFEQVQDSLEGKRPVLRGDANPFARPEVQEKIRAHWQREHGVDNPQQIPEVRGRTKATNLERYGGELLASPDIRAKAEATNLERYGAAFAGGTPEVQAKVVATNLAKYGVPHTCMDPEVRRKQLASMEEHYGSHFFASDEGKKQVRAALMEEYGVEFPGAIEGHWEKAKATFLDRYGVEHPLQLPEFVAKQEATNLERYGWENFIGSQDFVRACLKSYGVQVPDVIPDHPMKVREFARLHLERMRRAGPNLFERRLGALAPQLQFTGDGTFWRWLPLLEKHKNPDFILPGPDPEHPRRGVTKVVEGFGDYWHGRIRTGKAPFDHEQELVEAFAEIGIECLIIWESEVKTDPAKVKDRLLGFLAGSSVATES